MQVDNHGITNLYYISVEHVHYEVFRGKVDNGSMHCSGKVIVIPWVVRLYVEIIHEL